MHRVILLIINIMIYSLISGQDLSNVNKESKHYSTKLRMNNFGIYSKQFEINPSFCVSKKNEFSFGVYYRYIEYNYLIQFRGVPASAKFYGLTFGYINNIKKGKNICIRNEFNCKVSIIYTKFNYLGIEYAPTPVVAGTIYWGPNMKIKISNKIDINLLLQLGLGYGTISSTPIISVYSYGSDIHVELLPFIDFQYNF